MAQMNMIEAIRSAHDVMMERDPSVVVLGEDVGRTGGCARDLLDGAVAEIVANESLRKSNPQSLYYAAPVAVEIAERLGVNSDPFLMAVAIAASCAFLTPIGHKNNTLIMGPGGYRFGDYWRMGLPLEILIVAVAVPMILIVWPL